ncbi:MFS transporter [Alicyclobacillaceae bacterium I2511]|nr:MFS transporter [Alicyclobacillaceae bacterium I2511]
MFKRLRVILMMLVTVFIGFGLIIPVLPLMVKQVGAAPFQLGVMLAVYSAVAFVTAPAWGILSDRIGRKRVILTGLVGFALSFLLFGLAQHILWLMYVARIIGGGFSGAVTATAMAYIAEVTTPQERTHGMALAGASIGMGFIIGPGVGGLLSHFGVSVPFFVASALALANAAWGAVALHNPPPPVRGGERGESSALPIPKTRWAAFSGPLRYLYLVGFFSQLAVTSLEGTFQYFEMLRIHATATQIGGMFFFSGVVAALFQGGILPRFVKHGKELPALYVGLALSGVGLLSVLASTNFWNATLFITLFSVGNTSIRPPLSSLITKKAQVGQGLANGLLSSMDNLARVVGPLMATALYELHPNLPYFIVALISFAAISLLVAYHRSTKWAAIEYPLKSI